MYFTECASLAERHPNLASTVQKLDALLEKMGTAEVLRADDLASFLKVDQNQVGSILEMLADAAVLRRDERIECCHCRMTALQSEYDVAVDDDDEYTCTSCDQTLTDQDIRRVTTYRRGEKWEVTPGAPRRVPSGTKLDDEGWYGADRLAEAFGVGKNALRKRLDRYRDRHQDGWKENENRRPREPQYHYRLKDVRHIIEDLRASSERPAK